MSSIGTKEVPVANEQDFKVAKSRMLKVMKENPIMYPAFSKFGSPMVVEVLNASGILPTKNFSATGEMDFVEGLGDVKNQEARQGNENCYMCPVACSQIKLAKKGEYAGALSAPEYESMFCFGSVIGVDNLDSIIYADQLCDQLGLELCNLLHWC